MLVLPIGLHFLASGMSGEVDETSGMEHREIFITEATSGGVSFSQEQHIPSPADSSPNPPVNQ